MGVRRRLSLSVASCAPTSAPALLEYFLLASGKYTSQTLYFNDVRVLGARARFSTTSNLRFNRLTSKQRAIIGCESESLAKVPTNGSEKAPAYLRQWEVRLRCQTHHFQFSRNAWAGAALDIGTRSCPAGYGRRVDLHVKGGRKVLLLSINVLTN